MFTLRCTRKLLARIRQPVAPAPPPPTTRLGDWYANILFTPGGHLVLCVGERTLLPVVVPAREMATLVPRFRSAVAEVLRAMAIPQRDVDAEEREMAAVVFAPTANRQVLGSMTDFAYLLDAYREPPASLLEASLKLAEAPCSPLGMESPRRATMQLFSATPATRQYS